MSRCLRVLSGFVVLIGWCALPVVALEGTISPELETVERVFCLNNMTGQSIDATVTMDADGTHRYDCGALAGTTGDSISLLVQGTLMAPPPPPPGSNCVELLVPGTALTQISCGEDVPNNNVGTAQTGLIGDVYNLQAVASAGGTVRIDTTNRGDGMSNLQPAMVLLGPGGVPIAGSIDQVPCTFPPVCGGMCPRLSGALGLAGPYKLIVLDSPAPGCTGGGYRLQAASGGLTVTSVEDDVDTMLPSASLTNVSTR